MDDGYFGYVTKLFELKHQMDECFCCKFLQIFTLENMFSTYT